MVVSADCGSVVLTLHPLFTGSDMSLLIDWLFVPALRHAAKIILRISIVGLCLFFIMA